MFTHLIPSFLPSLPSPLHLYHQEQVDDTQPEPEPVPAPEAQAPADPPAPEDPDLTWEDKEDKLDAENIKPGATDKKYQYKTGGSLDLGPNLWTIGWLCFALCDPLISHSLFQ